MLKLLGIAAIMAGTLTGLAQWHRRGRERQKMLEELVFFFGQARYALEKEQMPLILFFSSYASGPAILSSSLLDVADRLEQNTYPDGCAAWLDAFMQHRQQWNLSGEQWDCLLDAGRAFFGRSRIELGKHLSGFQERMEGFYREEKRAFGEQRKVVVPLGILGGIMLVVMLV